MTFSTHLKNKNICRGWPCACPGIRDAICQALSCIDMKPWLPASDITGHPQGDAPTDRIIHF